jgi:hypothetical protein
MSNYIFEDNSENRMVRRSKRLSTGSNHEMETDLQDHRSKTSNGNNPLQQQQQQRSVLGDISNVQPISSNVQGKKKQVWFYVFVFCTLNLLALLFFPLLLNRRKRLAKLLLGSWKTKPDPDFVAIFVTFPLSFACLYV